MTSFEKHLILKVGVNLKKIQHLSLKFPSKFDKYGPRYLQVKLFVIVQITAKQNKSTSS